MLSSSMDAPLAWGLARKCRQISGGQSICANLVCVEKAELEEF